MTPSGTLKSNVIFRGTPEITRCTPTRGLAGTSVTITGTGLTQTTEVTFDGVKADSFTMQSDCEVMADVRVNFWVSALATPKSIIFGAAPPSPVPKKGPFSSSRK